MTDQRPLPKRQTIALLAITGVGLGLRLFHLGSRSYWLDEAISLGIARNDVATILTNMVQSSHPPLYYLSLKGWLALGLGGNETTVRLLSALLSTAAIPAVYALARVLFDTRTALVSAGLMAISPFQVLYAQEARMYGLLSLLMTLTLLAFVHAWRTNRLRNWLLFAAGATSCAYTHYFSFLVLAGVGLFALVEGLASRTWRRWPGLLLAGTMVTVLFAPQLGLFLDKATDAMGTRWVAPNPLYFFTSVYFLLLSYTLSGWLVAVAMFVSLFIVLLVLWQAVKTVRRLWGPQTPERRQKQQALLLLLSTAIAPVLILAVLLIVKPFWVPERTLTIVTPAYAVFLAQGLTQAPRRSPMPLLYGLLVVLMVVSLGNYYFDPQYAKPPYRDAAELIAGEAGPGDIEVHTSDGSYLPFLQYPQPVSSYLLRGDPDARKPDPVYEVLGGQTISREEALAQDQRIWLVVALEHSIDYQLETLDWFQGQRPVLEEYEVGGIRVYLLGKQAP
jgi:mannosyltransferase